MPVAERICVGRGQELDALGERLAAACGGAGGLCLVRGETGSGKSTLLRELAASAEAHGRQPVIAWGRCDPQLGELRPLYPWTGILEALTGTSDIVVPEEALVDGGGVLDRARSAFMEIGPDVIELLVPGFGLAVRSAKLLRRSSLARRLTRRATDGDRQSIDADRRQLEDQYLAVLERILAESPLVLLIDDIHCADSASLELLERLANKAAERPLLIVLAARSGAPTEIEERLGRLPGTAVLIDLDEAMRDRGEELVADYVAARVPGVSPDFVAALARHTGGLPLFLVELVDHLIQSEQLTDSAGEWQEVADIRWQDMPGAVANVLAAQLEELDEDIRELLQLASIEGDQFTVEVLAGVLEETPINVLRKLNRLAPQNLVEPLGTFQIGQRRATRFRFRHSLAHLHSYESVPSLERPYLHESVAIQLELLAGDAVDGALAAPLANHYERAGRADRAAVHHEAAAVYAQSAGALTEAIKHLERIDRLGLDDSPAVLGRLAALLTTTGRLEEAEVAFQRALRRRTETTADLLADLQISHAYLLTRLHRFDEAQQATDAALALADSAANVRAEALVARANLESKRGNPEQALEQAEAAERAAAAIDDPVLQARTLYLAGWCLKELGRFDAARKRLSDSLALLEGELRPNWSRLAATRNALADLEISLEHYPEARLHLEAAITAWRQFDQNSDVAVALNNLANLANRQGHFEEALAFGRDAYALDLSILGAGHAELAFALTCIGESQLGLGQYGDAVATLSEALDLREGAQVPAGNVAWTRWLLGRALVDGEVDVARGLEAVTEARTVFAAMGEAAKSELKDLDAWLAARAS